MNVVGISLVRNEADIIGLNIRYHLALGLDRLVIVDNGSDDDTPRILERLGRDRRVAWTRDSGPYEQAAITTELAKEAARAGADWVIPIDADEFLFPSGRDLKKVLGSAAAGALRVPVLNFIQRRDQAKASASAFSHLTRRVAAPVGPTDRVQALVEKRQIAFVEAAYPPKWVTRATTGLVIGPGNHEVHGVTGHREDIYELLIFHAPFRARSILDAKAEQGRRVEDSGWMDGHGWHVRRLLRLQRAGLLDEEWAANSYEGDSLCVGGLAHPLIFDPALRDAVSPFVAESQGDPAAPRHWPAAITGGHIERRDEPTQVVVRRPRYTFSDRKHILLGTIEVAGRSHDVWFRVSDGPVCCDVEPFVVLALVPAMRLGCRLKVEGDVSGRLLNGLAEIQQILHAWYRDLSVVPVAAGVKRPDRPANERGIGSFFSGGVDSFYSLIKHHHRVDKLVFVRGFDIAADDHTLGAFVTESLRAAAGAVGVPLVEVETNLRVFADQFGEWRNHNHGAAMASVALLLAPQFHEVLVPSSHSFRELSPCGSHSLLDPRWSTELTAVVHDGAEVSRVEKVRRIAAHDVALRWLRVCWHNSDSAYNCGRCEKCLRTKAELRLAGALERCATFDPRLDLQEVGRMGMSEITREFVVEALEAALQTNDLDLAAALRECLVNAQTQPSVEVALLGRQLRAQDDRIAALQELAADRERTLKECENRLAEYERRRLVRASNAGWAFKRRLTRLTRQLRLSAP